MAKKRKVVDPIYKDLMDSYHTSYKDKEWINRQSLFLNCLDDASISFEPLPVDIKFMVHKLDIIYTQASKDQINITNKLDKYKSILELKKKSYALSARKGDLKGFDKATSDESAKNSAIVAISNESIIKKGQTSYTLYDLIRKYEERLMVATTVIFNVKNKKELLVTDNAMLKLEANFDGDYGK
jgi:hypothetical protein